MLFEREMKLEQSVFEDEPKDWSGVPYWRAWFQQESPNNWMIQSVIWVQLAWSIIALVLAIVMRCGCKSQGFHGVTNRGLCIGLAISLYFLVPVLCASISLYTEVDDPQSKEADQLQQLFLAYLILTVINFSIVSPEQVSNLAFI